MPRLAWVNPAHVGAGVDRSRASRLPALAALSSISRLSARCRGWASCCGYASSLVYASCCGYASCCSFGRPRQSRASCAAHDGSLGSPRRVSDRRQRRGAQYRRTACDPFHVATFALPLRARSARAPRLSASTAVEARHAFIPPNHPLPATRGQHHDSRPSAITSFASTSSSSCVLV